MKKLYTAFQIFWLLIVPITAFSQAPTNNPTGFAVSAFTNSSLTVSWTNVADGFRSNYLVLYNTGAITDPTNGSAVSNSSGATSGAINLAGTATSNLFTGLNASTVYNFKIYAYNNTGILYLLTSVPTTSRTTLAAKPTTQPTSLIFSSPLQTGLGYTVAYSAASGTPTGYIALRKSGASGPTSTPADGTFYSAGTSFGDATVAFVDATPSLTFNETSLSASSQYSYDIYSYNGTGADVSYYLTGPLTGTGLTFGAEPTAQPTSLFFSSKLANGQGYTISYTAASGAPAGYIVLRKGGGSAPVSAPVDGTTYAVTNTFGDATVAFVDATHLLTFNESSLSPSTQYSYAVYAYNGSGASINYYQTSPLTGSTYTIDTEPSTQSTAMVISSITNTTLTVSWTSSGDGNNRILVVKQGGAPTAPTDGTTYVANTVIGSVTPNEITAAGSFVVYIGNGSTVDLTGFNANASYTFNLYEFNTTTPGDENYLTTSPLSKTQSTEDEPLNYPSGFAATATATITLNWTGSSGSPAPSNYLVLARDVTGGGIFPVLPTDGTLPGNDANLSSGSSSNGSEQIAFGTNTYNGWSNLTAGNLYEFQINPYTTAGSINPDYKTSPTAPTVQVYTEPSGSANNPTFSSVTPTSIDVTIAGATGLGAVGGYLVVRKTAAPLTPPVDGTIYTAGSSNIGGNPVVYIGAATTFTDGPLLSLTNYIYDVYVFSGTGALINYRTTSPGSANKSTPCAPPTGQATNVVFSSVLASSMTISWTSSGTADGALVLLNDASSPSAFSPTAGTTYTPNTVFGNGTDLEGGGGVTQAVFVAAGATVSVTGLSAGQAYTTRVYEYENSGTCYNLTSPATATQTTAAPSATSTLAYVSAAATISSVANSSGAKVAVLSFKITDTSAGDNAPTRFSQVIFRPGTGNDITTFTDLIGNSTIELRDASGNTQTTNITVTSSAITISSIANNTSSSGTQSNRLGIVNDGSNKIYTLNIWLNNPLGGSLPAIVDGLNFTVSLAAADVLISSGATGMLPGSSCESNAGNVGNGLVTVTATAIAFTKEPPGSATATVPFGAANQPILTAKDADGNSDLTSISATVTTPDATLTPTSAPTSFTNGVMDFSTANTFNYATTGNSRMTVTTTSAPSGLSVTSTGYTNVLASTNLGSSATLQSPSPLTNGTTGVINGGTGAATNAVLGFNLQTTGSSLTLSQLDFAAATNGPAVSSLVSNFSLYANHGSDSFVGASLVTTSPSSLTFSGLSITVDGTPTYFFLTCDVKPFFTIANPTIQFSLPAGNFTVSGGSGKTGSPQTGTNYLLQDLTPPDISSIGVASPTNAWSSTNGTSANSVKWTVTFTEPVSGANTLTNWRIVSDGSIVHPITPTSVTGSGTTYTVTVSVLSGTGHIRIELIDNNSITDVASNPFEGPGLTDYLTDFTNLAWYYSIVLPAPSNPVLAFGIAAQDDIELLAQGTANIIGPQLATNYLLMARESQGANPFPPVTNLLPDNQYDFTYPPQSFAGDYSNVNSTGVWIVNTTSPSNYFWLFKAGMKYDFIVYPYTTSANYSNDNIAYGPPSSFLNQLIGPNASNSTLNASSNPGPIASTFNSAGNMKQVFTFGVTDGIGTATGYEYAPTKISSITISPGGSNTVTDWTGVIAGAELFDVNSPSTSIPGAISFVAGASKITFSGIPSSVHGDLGYVDPSNTWASFTGTKTYGLRIYLNSASGALTDQSVLAFNVTQASFGYNSGLGTVIDHQSGSTIQSGSASSGAQTIDVQATKLVFASGLNLPAQIGVKKVFPTAPEIDALDANNNIDINFSTFSIALSNGAMTFSSTDAFSAGKLKLSNFVFNNSGATTITVSSSGVTSTTSDSDNITGGNQPTTAVITALTQIVGLSGEPATISSLATADPALGATLPQVVGVQNFKFKITDDVGATSFGDDGLPTLINSITITQNTSFNGLNDGGLDLLDTWTNVIQGAQLGDGTQVVNADPIVGNSLAFNTTGTSLQTIADDGSKTYTLKIWLKNPVNAALSDVLDHEDFVFDVINSNITVGASPTSSNLQASTASSANTKNAVAVVATQLDFTTQWAAATVQNYDATLSPTPVAKARDVNTNLDLDWNDPSPSISALAGPLPRTYPLDTNPTGGTLVTVSNGLFTFDPTLRATSGGNGQDGDITHLILSSIDLVTTKSATSTGSGAYSGHTFFLDYSHKSDIRRDSTFTYPTNILYASANNQAVAPLTNTNGIALEQFFIRDGGFTHSDADGSPTVLTSITLDVANYLNLRELALFNGSTNIKEVAVIPANYTVVGGKARITFSAFTFSAAKNTNAPLTIKGSFLGNGVIDNQVISFSVVSVQAQTFSSSQFANTSPVGIQSAVSGNQNKIEVVATQIEYTTSPTTASISVPFIVVTQAQDANLNLDADYNGAVSMPGAHPNGNTSDYTVLNLPSGNFTGGILNYPVPPPNSAGFQFTSGTVSTQLVINGAAANTAGASIDAGAITGISPTITVITSFESFITKDPTFTDLVTIPYVTHQETSLTSSSFELIRVLLLDGSRSSTATYGSTHAPLQFQTPTDTDGQLHGDNDGASTNIGSITIQISNPSNLRTIGLFDKNGTQLGAQIDVAGMNLTNPTAPQNFVFTGSPLLTAPDDSSAVFSVRASFNNTSTTVKDADDLQIQLIAVSIVSNSGSDFYNGTPANSGTGGPYIGGQVPSGPHSLGLIDVVSTSLDFTTQPSSFAGISEPIGIDPSTTQPYSYGNPPTLTLMPTTSPGTVTARDRFGLVDTGFAPPSILMTDAGNNPLLIPSSFVNGVLSLNGMHYTSVGNGTLTIIANRNAAGTITTSTGSTTVTGVGTNFNGELNVGSVIKDPSGNPIGTVLSIASSTSLTLASNAIIALTSSSYLAAVNSSNSSSSNSKPSATVTVLDVTATYDNSNGVVPPTIASPPGASLKGGNTGYNIFGLKFTANNISGSEPYLKGFTISFDVPFETPGATTFKNFIIKEVNSAGTFDVTSSTIGGTFSKGSSNGVAGTYDQIIVNLSSKPQPLGTEPTKSISFFLFVDVDSKVNLATPPITPSFSDRGYGFSDDQNSIVSNGTSTGAFTGNKYSFASTQPPILLTSSSDLTLPYSGQPNVDPYLQQITLQFNTDVGSFDQGGAGNAELWTRQANGTSKVADLIFSASQSLATVNPNNTVNNTYPTISYDIIDPTTHLPLTQPLDADSVYFVKLIKGDYNAVVGKGQGITDFGLNFYGGISSNSTLYFKISSNKAPVLSNAKSAFNTTSIGTVTTSFDQFGTAFFLIVKQGDPAPTKAQMLDLSLPSAYNLANPTATVGASGNYAITSINADQTYVFTASNFQAGQAYDVYIIAENDAISHGVSSPVVAAGVYGSSPYLPNTAGPTTTIPASGTGSIPGSVSNTTPDLANSNFLICPDSYSTISSPIIIAETPTTSFAAPYLQDFNILLPTGYQFDVTVAPNVQLFGADFSPVSSGGPLFTYKYTSNTVLDISFNNSTATNPDDFIVLTGLSIIGASGSPQGNINWFYGNNVFTNTPSYPHTFSLGTIAIQAVTPLDFYNSYWQDNKLLFNAIAPLGTAAGDALNKTVNAIPDNFQDKTFPGQLQLIPDNRPPFNKADYLASFFSGNGVGGDLFTLNSVATGAAFNITITHTDLNGCVTQKPEQYLVYDHRNTISNKLGLAYPAPSPLAGTQQAIVNTNWPAAAGAISSPTLGLKELAGYTLQQLTVDLPSDEIGLNQATASSGSQPISGASWRTLIQNSILNNSVSTYTWDYSAILNSSSSIVNSTPYKNINTASLGLNNVYDYFKSTKPTPILKSNYWQGGFLGNIEFTGIYNSTADNSVYAPFRQNVGLFVPAVPALEVTSTISKSDISDATTGLNGVTVQSLGTTNKIYASYPGTAAFCEQGGIINISGYPLATSGVSSGVFSIYDYASYDFTKVFVPSGTINTLQGSSSVTGVNTLFLTELKVGATLYDPQGNILGQVASIPDNTHLSLFASSPIVISSSAFRTNLNKPIAYATDNIGFVDNANGSMTLDPLSNLDPLHKLRNQYNDILVAYTYQENASPAFGIGYLVIRVTPNPVPLFTAASTIENPGASAFDKFCLKSSVNFDASVSTIAASSQDTTRNAINQFVWDFGDQNSTQNAANTAQASHLYNIASVYLVNLSLVSNWGCPSLPNIVAPTPGTNPVLYPGSGGNITVGDIPVPKFSMAKNCVGELITFDATKSSVPGNSSISTYNWDYNSQIPVANGLPNPSPATDSKTSAGASTTYSKSGFYNVVLTTITSLGCQDTLRHTISQLDVVSAFNNNFDSNDGGWQTINLASNSPGPGDPGVSWAWANTSGRTNSIFNSPNKMWVTSATPSATTGFYNPLEKSALYSACLNLDPAIVPRPMISYSSFVDVSTGDGLVLQYSIDNLNILDPDKTWTNLGSVPTGTSPGLDWYNSIALPSNPGNTGPTTPNSIGTGWSGNGKTWISPKHKLDSLSPATNRLILRFALSSVAQSTVDPKTTSPYDGVAIDNVFFGSRTRTILFENFTTTDDGGNSTLNSDLKLEADAITAFVQKNISGTQLVNVNYHVGFIGMDPFNQDNPADPGSRALYYNVQKVPYAFLDGIHYRDSTQNPPSDLFKYWGQKEYDLNTLQLAKANFQDPGSKPTTVTLNPDGSLQVDVNFTPVFALPSSPIVGGTQAKGGTILQVAILEKQINSIPKNGNVTTGETSFGYVLKKMLPNAVGTKFSDSIKANVPVSVSGPTLKWTPENLHSDVLTVVVFLQNEDTKEVYQAFIQDDIQVAIVTAIEPLSADNIKVYPNPSDQEFTIELPSPAQQNMRITMANQLGQFTEIGNLNEGEKSKKISTQGLSEGVYILQLGSNGNALRTKVVVLHK